MSGNNSHPVQEQEPVRERRRSSWPLLVVAALFIIVPFLAWYGTWFGRELTDEKITEYLSDEQKTRHVQHALAQIAARLEKRDANARKWYPQIVALSKSSVAELRSNVAWLMGKDNQSQEFHAALLELLNDKEPLVQRNAALSLVTFNDAKSLPVLRSMLQPFPVTAPVEATVSSILKESTPVRHGMMVSRLKASENQFLEVRSPLQGELSKAVVAEGAQVKAGDTLLFVSPDEDSVWEALRALYIMGQPEDLSSVERYAQGVEGMSGKIKEQAALTAKAIQSRAAKTQ